jgi:exosortase/archaeosortase family protein
VALLAIPAAVHLGIPRRKLPLWMAVGVGVALLSNVLRILVVLAVAQWYGLDVAMGTVHPVLGALLLMAVLAWMWSTAPRSTSSGTRVTRGPLVMPRPAMLAAVGVLAGVFAFGSARLGVFEPLAPIGPPGDVLTDPLDYVQLPAGWDLEGRTEMPWQDLFGPDSTSYAMSFRSADGALVKAQFVATPDQGRLNAYSLEACRVYHGDDVVGVRTIDLGEGGVASLIDTSDQAIVDPSGRMSVLYWEAPFSLEGRLMHARMALFVVESDAGTLPADVLNGVAPGGRVFDRADTLLVGLARGMAGELVGSDHGGV